MSAPAEYVGANFAAAAAFQQTGGVNATNYLAIGSGDQYVLSGGTLQIGTNGLLNQGTFDGGTGPGLLAATGGIVDLSQGTLKNTGDCR